MNPADLVTDKQDRRAHIIAAFDRRHPLRETLRRRRRARLALLLAVRRSAA